MVRFCASLRLFVCPAVFLLIKIVSKIQTTPVRLGPTIALNVHTGHDTVEDDTHSFSNIKFKGQGHYGNYFYERQVKECKLNHPCFVHKNYTHTDHNTRERHITFLLDCKANSSLWNDDFQTSVHLSSASTIWLSCCVKVNC